MIKDSAKGLFKIDQFVNAVYVFDDKLVLTYNYQHGTEAISLDEIESALSLDFNGATPPAIEGSQRCDPFLSPLWFFDGCHFRMFRNIRSDTYPPVMIILTCIDIHDRLCIDDNRYLEKEE